MTTSLVTNDSPLFLTKVTVNDADYTTTLTNGLLIAYTALTAPRTVTLPPATTSGQIVTVVDESGACNPTNIITIAGTIDGATNKTLNSPYSAITLESNGAGGYAILSKSDVSVTAPLTGNGTSVTPLAIPAATTSVNGYLTSTDWNTFNGKQAALGFTPINKAGDTGIGNLSMGALGTNGKTPQTSASVNAACTDLATAIALINQLRAALIANGICV
jgi:hypothetical protein